MRLWPAPLLAAAALLLGAGCSRGEPTPESDRTLARLKQEAERVAAHGPGGRAPAQDPNAGLATLAAAQADARPADGGRLQLPEGNATVHVGTVAVKLLGLTASHAESTSRVTLTTEELFLRVQLITQNVGERAAKLDFNSVRVIDGRGGAWTLARDVQRLAGTRELAAPLEPMDRREYVLFFEVPRPGPTRGWSLLLSAPGGGEQDVSIPLG